jgi:hypothetical protein
MAHQLYLPSEVLCSSIPFDTQHSRCLPPACSRLLAGAFFFFWVLRFHRPIFIIVIMDSSMQRSDSLKSITNFANRMNPRRSLNIFKRQGSFASNRTSRQEIEEARTRYLDARGKILREFIRQRKDSHPWTEILHDPILSANGDIKSDFALMECLHDEQEKVELKCILLILYGTSSLRLSSGAP